MHGNGTWAAANFELCSYACISSFGIAAVVVIVLCVCVSVCVFGICRRRPFFFCLLSFAVIYSCRHQYRRESLRTVYCARLCVCFSLGGFECKVLALAGVVIISNNIICCMVHISVYMGICCASVHDAVAVGEQI